MAKEKTTRTKQAELGLQATEKKFSSTKQAAALSSGSSNPSATPPTVASAGMEGNPMESMGFFMYRFLRVL